MPVKQKFNTSEKMYDSLVNFGSFLWKFAIILTDFCYPDPFHESNPDPAGRMNGSKRVRIRNTA